MTQTFTQEHRAKLEQYLATHDLPEGLSVEESACSIAAINLAISGRLTDEIPDCMSDVLGEATIRLQDAMPGEMRNSLRYKTLLPDMAGTGREHEQERRTIIMDWMWSVVLPQLQPLADKHGFGDAWKNMCQLKTAASALAARALAAAAARAARALAAAAAAADDAAARAAAADDAAARAAASLAAASLAAARAAAGAAAHAADAADVAAARAAARTAAGASRAAGGDLWVTVDPIGVLERMTYLNVETSK
jgi:hypothetical protein